jgi:hypothetical protein
MAILVNKVNESDAQRPKNSAAFEAAYAVVHFLCLLLLLKKSLLIASTTYSHDNFLWNFPIFHFFAETLLQGEWPWWNPYTHGGEPFYPILGQMRLFEPITLLTVLIGGIFTKDLILLFNWHRMLLSLWMLLGMYLVLRSHLRSLFQRLCLITILFYSSTFLGSLRADGYIHNFLWVPWLLRALEGIFEKQKTGRGYWCLLALSLGINFQSYFFVLPVTVLAIYLFCQIVRKPRATLGTLSSQRRRVLLSCLAVFLMAAPNAVLFWEKDRFDFPTRKLGVVMDLSEISRTGTSWSKWNLLQLVAPEGNPSLLSADNPFHPWGNPAEAFVYLGLLTLLLSAIGLFRRKRSGDFFWLFSLLISTLLALGPSTFFYRLIFPFFPPLWLLRQNQFFAPLIGLCLLYFFCRGFTGLRRGYVPALLMMALILSTALSFSPDKSLHLKLILGLFLLPLVLILKTKSKRLREALVLLTLVLDLGYHFQLFHRLYDDHAPPHSVLGVPRNVVPFEALTPRTSLAIEPSLKTFPFQNMRYLEWITRTPALFDLKRGYLELKKEKKNLRESLAKFPDRLSCPGAESLRVIDQGASRLSLEIKSSGGCELLWMNAHDKFWVGGLSPGPFLSMQASVPPGTQRMSFRYEPWPFLYGLLVFYSTLFTTIFLGLTPAGLKPLALPARIRSYARAYQS